MIGRTRSRCIQALIEHSYWLLDKTIQSYMSSLDRFMADVSLPISLFEVQVWVD